MKSYKKETSAKTATLITTIREAAAKHIGETVSFVTKKGDRHEGEIESYYDAGMTFREHGKKMWIDWDFIESLTIYPSK